MRAGSMFHQAEVDMKKLQGLAVACGVMLMLVGGTALAQDYGDGHDRGRDRQQQDNGNRGYNDGGARYVSYDQGDDHGHGHGKDHGHGHGNAYGHYKSWGDRGRHEGWYKRGGYLPVEYRSTRYVVTDWRGARLRQPPRGYHWVRSDDGAFLLVAITTGIIANIIASGH